MIAVILFLYFYIQVYSIRSEGSNAQPVFLPPEASDNDLPILIWWTPFTPYNRIVKNCVQGSCIITHSRTELTNPRTEGFIFYGTDLKWTDLPLPRNRSHHWALLHEESPKNNWGFAFEEGISLFNITSTPSRYSSYPLVTQYLESLQAFLRPLKHSTSEKSRGDIGLVMYLHSDCDPPSDRDSYVSELMKYVKVDSYGKCLHNKDLPEHLRNPVTSMDSDELVDIIAQYKFTLAMENAICDDYITEKFWRPLYAGSVPIVKGSPTVTDWAPSEHSVILIDNYKSPKELADYLLYLDKNDDEYEKYLMYKHYGVTNLNLIETMNSREWGMDGDHDIRYINHIEGFECYVCDQVIERRAMKKKGLHVDPLIAHRNHYACEYPKPMVKRQKTVTWWKDMLLFWRQVASQEKCRVTEVAKAISSGKNQNEVTLAYNNAQVLNDEYRLAESDYVTS